MRTMMFGLAAAVAIAATASTSVVRADTGSPHAQTSVLDCNGQLVTFVSPVEPALAAQVTGTTNVGILLRLTFDGEVLFELPASRRLPAGLVTTCTDGPLTFTILLTPPSH
jgi:xanthine/CO dehydrogenase XdhC/CoxF family maturation factor